MGFQLRGKGFINRYFVSLPYSFFNLVDFENISHQLRILHITYVKMIELSLFFVQVLKIVCIQHVTILVRKHNYPLHRLQIL